MINRLMKVSHMINFQSSAILILLLMATACAGTSQTGTTSHATGTKNTPSYIVTAFLDAFMAGDFGKAYNYIHSNATDKQGYVSRMENLMENSKNKITNYNLIGTRIIGDIAYVVVELELEISGSGADKNLRYTKNQYELSNIDGKWKIVKDHGCVENCTGS